MRKRAACWDVVGGFGLLFDGGLFTRGDLVFVGSGAKVLDQERVYEEEEKGGQGGFRGRLVE